MTPLEYEALYKALKIEFPDGTSGGTVSVNQYWLKGVQPEGQKIIDGTRKLLSKGKVDVKVNGKVVTFDKYDDDLNRRLHYALSGKGSPEDYQMILQLAVLIGPTKAGDLQAWADKNLGIDCNGFVGNYLWHLKNDWPTLFATDKLIKRGDAPNADMTVDGFFDRGRAIGGLDKIQPAELNVFGLIDGTTFDLVPRVIKDGAGNITVNAHIVISQPGKFQKVSPGPGLKLYIVESTGMSKTTGKIPGLTDNWCTITEFLVKGKPRNARNYPALRVFNVHRDSKNQDDLFGICSFPVS